MKYSILATAATLYSVATAQPNCKNITVPVTISARNGKFAESLTPKTGVEVTNFFLKLTRQGTNFTENVLQGYDTISGSFNIAATYCEPAKGAPDVIQMMTHGVGFDRSYWNLPFDNFNYSYTNVAVEKFGFATFTYDRLGIGESQHGDPLNSVQSWTEMAALEAMTTMLRNGSIKGLPKFGKVLHVGHSYGSIQTAGVLQTSPNTWDGVALTGFSTEMIYLSFFELAADFIDAKSLGAPYPAGYLAPSGAPSLQESLFSPDAFDPAMLPYLEKIGVPPTVGEFLTLSAGSAAQGPPLEFTGPALVITGQHDLPFTGGNALQPYEGFPNIPSAAEKLFPRSRHYETVIVPNTGHGLNLHYSHLFTYNTVNRFFIDNGLGP